MGKKYSLALLLIILALPALSQTYGNEWVSYSQKYYRIQVYKDGIYRLDSATLANAGIPVGNTVGAIDPRHMQIWGMGKEQYIFIKGEGDGQFNTNDTLEFYGHANDGAADSTLYPLPTSVFPSRLPNPYVSLFNDTAVYYLTWNTSLNNHRMVNSSDTTFSTHTPNAFMYKQDVYAFRGDYFQGTTDYNNITDPEYLPMECMVCNTIFYGGNTVASMNTANAYTGPMNPVYPKPRLQARVVTRSNDFAVYPDYQIQITYPNSPSTTTYTKYVDGYTTFLLDTTLSATALASSSPVTLYSINPGTSSSSGDAAFAYVSIKYPHTLDLEGLNEFKMYVPQNIAPVTTSFFNFSNFNSAGTAARFYDLTYHRRIKVVPSASNYQLLLNDSTGMEKFCYLTSDNNTHRVTSISPVNTNGYFTNYHLQAGDSAFVMISNSYLWSSAQAYKLYRSSVQGGSNHVVLADIADLYDQFAYGIRMHPLSIRRFCSYLMNTYPSKPKYLFLVGKSIDPYRMLFSPFPITSLLPTIGYPPSDNLFTAKLSGSSYAPAFATGRIASMTNNDVLTYLNKITAYEQNAAAPWMKQVLHFGGGDGAAEQSVFKTYLNNFKTIIEANRSFGGHVTSFFKTSSSPIQINQSDSLKLMIDNGVSIMTFFGHASGSGFDQSIDDPMNYNNVPRFPLIIANSCYAGNIHVYPPSTSEKFININRGAIGFVASTYLGIATELYPYTTGLYRSLALNNYGKSIGGHLQYAVRAREAMGSFGLYAKCTALTMTLDGDPSVVIASPRLPDYAISNPDLSFDTNTNPDSVTVTAIMHNNGRADTASYFVRLLRKFPNGDTNAYKKFVKAPAWEDSVKFRIPVDFNRGIGLNKISVVLDFTNRITEITKSNNSTGDVDLLLQGSSILPVWPYNDAIYPYDTVTLKSSTANPLEPRHDYRIQFDTTDTYNSPFFKTAILSHMPGGVISWKPPVAHLTDSTVYYWRISPDTAGTSNKARWKESSFQYITGKRGWEQAHFFQFKNDAYQFVKFSRAQRLFNFVNDVKSIEINNAIMAINGHDWPDVNYKINGTTLEESSCAVPGFSFAVLNPVSLKPWGFDTVCTTNIVLPYNDVRTNNTVCVCNTPLNAYDFYDTPGAAQSGMQGFMSSIPAGYYVLGFTNAAAGAYDSVNSYTPGLINQFRNLGCTKVGTTLGTQSSYVFLGRKGWLPGQAKELVSANPGQKITLDSTLRTNWNSGYVASEVIGPAKSWDEFHLRLTHLETPNYDSVVVRLIGISASGVQTALYNFSDTTKDVYNLPTFVNALNYPYIRLVAYMRDDTSRTPAQIKRWQVIYSQAPEIAVNPPLNFSMKQDTLQEGATLTMTCAVQNIGDKNVTDSILINYWLVDKNHVRHNLVLANGKTFRVRKPPLNIGSWFIDTVKVVTTGYPGLNTLWMEANPLSTVRTFNEQFHFNNLIEKTFLVTGDKVNPLLDVTFDGVHILDGDIVSAKPNVLISLKDENQYLALNDTADFKLFLQYPNSTTVQPVFFRNQITFTPAVLPKNSCRLNYTPILKSDGIYTLFVQAKDRSNNASGAIDYQIHFDVINHAAITNVMNYPNPFTTATHFVFTITGSEVPTTFRIQIMTVAGKLVREIERSDLGPLHIGRNITEYAWDGRDQFGDRLANGVYFYRVLTKINSDNIEHMDSGADNYFDKGFGKMFLMR
ncbi:MAG: C25 family cysteine peptidase [Bacteroidia bacterium]